MADIFVELLGDANDHDVVASVIKYLKQKDNNTPAARKLLLRSDWVRYLYCKDIHDDEDVWQGIGTDYVRFMYCRYVKDRKELWSKIRSSDFAKMYCKRVEMRAEVAVYVKMGKDAYKAEHWRELAGTCGSTES